MFSLSRPRCFDVAIRARLCREVRWSPTLESFRDASLWVGDDVPRIEHAGDSSRTSTAHMMADRWLSVACPERAALPDFAAD